MSPVQVVLELVEAVRPDLPERGEPGLDLRQCGGIERVVPPRAVHPRPHESRPGQRNMSRSVGWTRWVLVRSVGWIRWVLVRSVGPLGWQGD